MLDIQMLDELARPGARTYVGVAPPTLEDIFARVVADGWEPRRIAGESELDELEAATIRGTCLNPLLFADDVVYIDRRMSPQPGDIVSFRLSRRAVEAQNSALPPGQSPCRPGDAWCKLYAPYHGFRMLLERHGNAITASFATSEDPDTCGPLWPVRQVRRNGRLLFAPDLHAGQVGQNGATQTYSTTIGGSTSIVDNTSPFNVFSAIGSISVGANAYASRHVVTVNGNVDLTNNAFTLTSAKISLHDSTHTYVLADQFVLTNQVVSQGTLRGPFSFEGIFSIPAGTAITWNVTGLVTGDSHGTISGNANDVTLKVEVILR
jgi:hypothetical protein